MKCSKCEVNNENVIVTIKDKNKEVSFCMNCLVECCINKKFNFKNDENLIDDVTGEKGAIQYISKEVTYVLEKRTMIRSGETEIPQVKAARNAFFELVSSFPPYACVERRFFSG